MVQTRRELTRVVAAGDRNLLLNRVRAFLLLPSSRLYIISERTVIWFHLNVNLGPRTAHGATGEDDSFLEPAGKRKNPPLGRK